MPEESGTWNGRGQIKPEGLPGRAGGSVGGFTAMSGTGKL